MRRPITLDILSKLCLASSIVCISEYEAMLFYAAFVLIFFAAPHISEMLPNNKQSLASLRFNEVSILDNKVLIFIRRSKTDHAGKGHWLSLYACSDLVICPLLLLKISFL